jgi:hypothetical protein
MRLPGATGNLKEWHIDSQKKKKEWHIAIATTDSDVPSEFIKQLADHH